MLCTSLAILQLSGVKLPRALLWTSGYSDWSLSEKVSTRYRRFFHLTLLRSFKACKPPTSFFFLFSHKTVARKYSPTCIHTGKPRQHDSKISTSGRKHTADDVQVEHHYPNVHGPKQQRSERQRWCQFCYKKAIFHYREGKEKKKSSLCPSPQKARSTALGKPAAASYQKSRLMS